MVQFEVHTLPPHLGFLGAIASSVRIPWAELASSTPSAEWVARLGEDDTDFRARIAAELATAGRPDAPVYLYIARQDS